MAKANSAILSAADTKAKAKMAATALKLAQQAEGNAKKALAAAIKSQDAEVKAVTKAHAGKIKDAQKAVITASKTVAKVTPPASSPKL